MDKLNREFVHFLDIVPDHKERDDENVIGDVWTEGGVKRHGRKS